MTFFTGSNADDMVAVGTDLYVSFGTAGLYEYDGGRTRINSSNPGGVAQWVGCLAIDFDTYSVLRVRLDSWFSV